MKLELIKYFLGFTIFSLLISLFLFYIDEGGYSFDSILTIDNMLSLLILTIVSSVIVTFTYWLIAKFEKQEKFISIFFSVIIGYPLGFFIAFTLLTQISKAFM